MLQGKQVLITGSSGKIGTLLSNHFIENGSDCVCHYNKKKPQFGNKNNKHIQADFSKDKAVTAFCKSLPFAPEIFIHCISTFFSNTFLNSSRETLIKEIETNANIFLFLARELAQSKTLHNIIFFIDPRHNDINKNNFTYGVSQHLLQYYLEILSLELAPDVRVNALAPGIVNIGPNVSIPENFPIKKAVQGAEIIEVINLILSSASMSGQIIYLDGGRHLLKGQSYRSNTDEQTKS